MHGLEKTIKHFAILQSLLTKVTPTKKATLFRKKLQSVVLMLLLPLKKDAPVKEMKSE